MTPKKVLFITGTRADYGKMKSLMKILSENPMTEVYVFVCGMHLSQTFGSTYNEVLNDGHQNVYVAYGLSQSQNGSVNLGFCPIEAPTAPVKGHGGLWFRRFGWGFLCFGDGDGWGG
jgi:hypothetical protein